MSKVLVNTENLSREEWLSWRNKGIGGSDVAAVCGISKYKSPVELWMEKTGQLEPKESGEAAYWGTILEPNCGARQGELLALKWDDIDFENKTIRINETVKRVRTFDSSKNKTELLFKIPKTTSSNRIINIASLVMNELSKHKIRQNEEKLKTGSEYVDNNLVFCTDIGKPLDTGNIMRIYKRILKRSGIDTTGVTFHTLTHVFGSRLNDLNVDPKTIQALMGHSSIKTTMDIYVHASEEKQKEAANKINSLYSNMIKK